VVEQRRIITVYLSIFTISHFCGIIENHIGSLVKGALWVGIVGKERGGIIHECMVIPLALDGNLKNLASLFKSEKSKKFAQQPADLL
jgi:hypothetical protein